MQFRDEGSVGGVLLLQREVSLAEGVQVGAEVDEFGGGGEVWGNRVGEVLHRHHHHQ